MAPREIGALPPPSAKLHDAQLPSVEYRAPLIRIHRVAKDPAFWGRTGENRFDAPAAEFGVLYASTDHHGAFIETFGDALDRIVTAAALRVRGWARVEPLRALRLVDLTGQGLAHIGADERLCSGEHGVAQQWSFALWGHSSEVDGLYYRARRDPSRVSIALFDRAAAAVTIARDGALLDESGQSVLADILETYQFALL